VIFLSASHVAIRTARGLSQQAEADVAHVSRPHISQLETDGIHPSDEVVDALARALDVPREALVLDLTVDELVDEAIRVQGGSHPEVAVAVAILHRVTERS